MMESLYVAVIVCFLIQVSVSLKKERSEIVQEIIQRSKPYNIPIVDDIPVKVEFHYSLINIQRADVEHNEVDVLLWLFMQWSDTSLSWNKECTTFDHVSAPISSIWTPDLAFYNSVGAPEMYSHSWVMVRKNGYLAYVPQVRLRMMCDLSNLSREEAATCHLKAGSWTHSTKEFTLVDNTGASLADYSADSKFIVLNATQAINKKAYPCCPELYEDVTLNFTFKKK